VEGGEGKAATSAGTTTGDVNGEGRGRGAHTHLPLNSGDRGLGVKVNDSGLGGENQLSPAVNLEQATLVTSLPNQGLGARRGEEGTRHVKGKRAWRGVQSHVPGPSLADPQRNAFP
jgi:hypothetical protein